MCEYNSEYDSEMYKITIPLLGFRSFHHTNNNNGGYEDLNDFIGRKSILNKLQALLEDKSQSKDKYSVGYLITGFRGMGTSSFVHKAIQNMICTPQKRIAAIMYQSLLMWVMIC